MTRFTAALRWDVRLQLRNGFYYAAAFIVVILILVVGLLGLPAEAVAFMLPLIILQNVTINTFYFLAGLVLLEKGEGTLEALIVSPLRVREYLGSKLATLVTLCIFENVALVLVLYGPAANLALLVLAVVLLGIFMALAGFIVVARYESINTFLFPSVVVTVALTIPLLDYLGMWQSWLIYLHPIQGPLLLLSGVFSPIAAWQLVYGLLSALLWIALAYGYSQRTFYRFVVRKEGTRMFASRRNIGHTTSAPRGEMRRQTAAKSIPSEPIYVRVLKALGPIDLRNIWRDTLLLWMALMPFVFALLFRYLIPWVRESLLAQFGFDLAPYYVLLMSYAFVVGIPVLFGVVIGFLLLDERDDHTLTALQVTPMSLNNYLAYRVSLPMLVSAVLTVVTYPIAGMLPLPILAITAIAIVAAPLAPIFALVLAAFAQNKVQGFAVMKGLGGILMIPLVAYFVDSGWQWIFGLIPTFWPLKLYWITEAGQPGVLFVCSMGLVVQFGLLWLLARRFNIIMHR